MPVYEYRCRSCGHQFDIQQSFTDDALTVCPECDGELRKVFAPVGIAFKGSGFYKTDSRSGSSSGAASSSTSSSGSTGGSNGSSGDTGSSGSDGGGSSADKGSGSSDSGSGGGSTSTPTSTPSAGSD
jgi:putative FmdB family regulatory protein